MFRSLLLSSALSLAAIGGTFAADLPSTKGEPVYTPPPPPPPTWTGFYIGVNGGYGGGQFVYPLDGALTGAMGVGTLAPGGGVSGNGNANITSSGFLAGGQIGYNYQFPASNFVAGVEADIDWTSIRGQLGASLNASDAAGDSLSANGYAGSHLEYLGTARVRLGYAFGNLLPYITGGFAYGQTSSYYNLSYTTSGPNIGSNSGDYGNSAQHFQTGWTAGAGLEYQITPNLTFKTEYLYASLSPATLYSISGTGFYFNLQERTTINEVRAGLNYRFDWFAPPAPVVAKY